MIPIFHSRENGITDTGAAALARVLQSNTSLRYLDLQDNELTDVGAVAMAQGLAGPEGALKTLQLGYNDISVEGAAALLARCHHSPNPNPENDGPLPCSLTSLDLQFNELGPGVADVVVAALRGRGAPLADNSSSSSSSTTGSTTSSTTSNAVPPAGLTTLGLLQTGLGSSGAAVVAEALRTNTVLRSLDLGSNEIGDEGAAALARALQPQQEAGKLASEADDSGNNPSKSALAHLFLFDNGIEEAGAAALASLLTHNEQLTFLDLEENDALDDDDNLEVAASMALIEAGLQRNRKAKINQAAKAIADADAAAAQSAASAAPETVDSSAAASAATTAARASAAVPPCSNAIKLNFEGDGLGDEGAILLLNVLLEAPKSSTTAGVLLPELEVVLDDCGITEAGALRLAECCEAQPRMTQLSLKFNPIFKQSAANFDEGDEDEVGIEESGDVAKGGNGASTSPAAERIETALANNREARSRE